MGNKEFEFDNVSLRFNHIEWILLNKDTGDSYTISFTQLSEDCDFLEAHDFCKQFMANL